MAEFPESGREWLTRPPFQQLWRDHLLAGSMVLAGDYDEGWFVLVFPMANERCARVSDCYESPLGEDGTFRTWQLEGLLADLRALGAGGWVERVYDRYAAFEHIGGALGTYSGVRVESLGMLLRRRWDRRWTWADHWPYPMGWTLSGVHPEDALQALPCLHLDPRFQLAAFQYLADGGTHGYGAVWAVSADVPRAALAENCRLTGDASEPPPGALDDAMGAIDGDRSPWSYLCASMLSRELGDLGAVWHGADWMHHRVLSGPPWERRAKEWWVEVLGTLRQEDFRWLEPPPACWEPRVEVESDEVRVVFHTWYVAHGSRIERHIDRYRPGGYVAEREATVVAEGLGDCFI